METTQDKTSGFDRLNRFSDVDATDDAPMFAAFLDRVDAIPDVIRRRRRSCDLLGVRVGTRLIDVGCGLGTAVREVAHVVGPGGCAIGVDSSAAMIDEAAIRADREGVRATFLLGDAAALPVDDRSMTGYRAERLFQHLEDPAAALADAYRVLEPSGRLVLIDQDWDALLLDADDRETTRTIVRAFSDSLAHGWIGRRHHRLLVEAAFTEVEIVAETTASTDFETYGFVASVVVEAAIGCDAITADRGAEWLADQRRRADDGIWFMAMTHFLTSARR